MKTSFVFEEIFIPSVACGVVSRLRLNHEYINYEFYFTRKVKTFGGIRLKMYFHPAKQPCVKSLLSQLLELECFCSVVVFG